MSTRNRRDNDREDTNRIQRTYNVNNLWYFELRGGGQQGPFDSEREMQLALSEFIKIHHEFS
jgi:hypothetical protein